MDKFSEWIDLEKKISRKKVFVTIIHAAMKTDSSFSVEDFLGDFLLIKSVRSDFTAEVVSFYQSSLMSVEAYQRYFLFVM